MKTRYFLLLASLLALAALTAGCEAFNSKAKSRPDHIFVIVMENHGYGEIIGQSAAPYLNSLTTQYALATQYTAVAHPSEPNYIALFSGSTQGVTDDGVHDLTGGNLADQLEAKGMSWRVVAQNVPTNCFQGSKSSGGADGQGNYVRKHNPAISFTNISGNPKRCANITDFAHFDPAAANFQLIVPNMCNDMHDCDIATGDAFLRDFVPRITTSRAWQDGGILFIVWDEGNDEQGASGDRVPLFIISNRMPPGFQFTGPANHYALLRTIQEFWNLDCLAESCKAPDLMAAFK